MLKTLKIEESTARNIYRTATPELKVVLEENFGKEFFNQKITDRVKTWNDVLEISGKDEDDILPFSNPKTKQQKSLNALTKIHLISEVLNEGWIPDWNNANQPKYYPYFEKKASGWVVRSFDCVSVCSDAGAGQHFKSSELALYAANTFLNIYQDYLP